MPPKALAAVLSIALAAPAWAFPGFSRRPPSASSRAQSNPSLNAVLYAALQTPGTYATGSTALAVNGSGTPVALSFARAGSTYYADTPGTNGAGWYATATTGLLRVGGNWVGAQVEPAATNLFATPTDSPTSSGNWSFIAAGPTVTANVQAFADGTTTATGVTESAAAITGIQQSVSVSSQSYVMSAWFSSPSVPTNRQCWGLSLDGTTVHAKFDINAGSVTYVASGASAGVSEHIGLWVRVWARATLTAGTVTPQFFATAACADSTKAATGGTKGSYIARVQFQATTSGGAGAVNTTYTPTGTAKVADIASFPISMTGGNACLSAKVEPMHSTWETRAISGILSAFSSATNTGAANSMYLMINGGGAAQCWVYDSTPALKSVSITRSSLNDRAHALKCCTDSSGNLSIGYDGSMSSPTATGAGTGILSSPLTVLYLGTLDNAANALAPIAISDVAVCNVSDGQQCSDWALPAQKMHAALGDSITAGVAGAMNTTPWTATAAAAAGVTIVPIAHGGWGTDQATLAWAANLGHRYRKVAVHLGFNDLGARAAGEEFDRLRQIYMAIIAAGSTPLPMTMLPAGMNAANEAKRVAMNAAILKWCAQTGYTCADAGAYMDDPGAPGNLRAAHDNGDHVHPNAAGLAYLGNYMATYFQ